METQIMTKILTSHGATAAFGHPTPFVPAQEWACAGADPDTFFPEDEVTLARALALCEVCPLTAMCRDLALARKESGVWGGILLEAGKTLDHVPVRGRPPKAA
jgi:hypothetical protein